MSTDRWIDKGDVAHIYNGMLFSHKKNEIMPFVETWRDFHPKWSKSERERQIPYDITYMWNLKYDTNEIIYETETEFRIYRTNLCLPKGRELGEGRTGSLGLADVN